ncbi:MAG: recombinase family protein [Pseudomonadota bacterium]
MSNPEIALIYCRVSHTKQKTSGTGLDSQEHRCRAYAASKGYTVETVFPDDASGGGDFMQRPGMVAMLRYLKARPHQRYVIVFDDLKRFARDTIFHWKLREELAIYGARVECLNFNFEDTPEGAFVETVVAAQGQLEREQNRRQTLQKMTARLEQGYWVFQNPVGYKYEKTPGHGNLLVPDEPVASIVREALEGYASGRFQLQTEVARFLEQQPVFPRDRKGRVPGQKIKDILTRVIYAGYVETPTWNIKRRPGMHEPLINLQTFQAIQNRLQSNAYAPMRKNFDEDFPLRGFVLCQDCDKPLTACWSQGKNKAYPYYYCVTKGCESRSRTIRREVIEGEFEDLLKAITPHQDRLKIAAKMLEDWWKHLGKTETTKLITLKTQLSGIASQIERLTDRLIDAQSSAAIKAYENRLTKLEEDKAVLEEKIADPTGPRYPLSEVLRTTLSFLSKPHKLWASGRIEYRRAVLKLAFSERISYAKGKGFSNTKFSLPFRELGSFRESELAMARPG